MIRSARAKIGVLFCAMDKVTITEQRSREVILLFSRHIIQNNYRFYINKLYDVIFEAYGNKVANNSKCKLYEEMHQCVA